MNHVGVDLDDLSTRAGELAVQLGVRAPRIKAGRLPKSWFPEGVLIRMLAVHPVVVIGASFDDLSAAEQEGTLASVTVQADLMRQSALKFATAAVLLVGAPTWLFAYGLGLADAPAPLALVLLLMTFGTGYFAAWVAWGRRLVYRTDRRIAEVLGRPVMHALLDLDRRLRYQRRGIVGIYVNLFVPSAANRADAISYLAPSSHGPGNPTALTTPDVSR